RVSRHKLKLENIRLKKPFTGNSNLRPRLKQPRVCKFFSIDLTLVRAKLTGTIMNSPGKHSAFVGSRAANSHRFHHPERKATSLPISTASIFPASNPSSPTTL